MPIKRAYALTGSQMHDFKYSKRKSQKVMLSLPPKKKSKAYGEKGPEIKFLDVNNVLTANSTAVVVEMSTMAQGLTNSTRIGNKICVKSVAVRINSFPITNSTGCNPNNTKWSIVLDKEPEAGAAASYNQIYTSNSPNAFNNVNYSDRFVVLATGCWSHGARSLTATQAYSDGGDFSKLVDEWRHCDISAKYLLTTATQTAIGSNQLLFTIVDEFTDSNIAHDVSTRIRYTDE